MVFYGLLRFFYGLLRFCKMLCSGWVRSIACFYPTFRWALALALMGIRARSPHLLIGVFRLASYQVFFAPVRPVHPSTHHLCNR